MHSLSPSLSKSEEAAIWQDWREIKCRTNGLSSFPSQRYYKKSSKLWSAMAPIYWERILLNSLILVCYDRLYVFSETRRSHSVTFQTPRGSYVSKSGLIESVVSSPSTWHRFSLNTIVSEGTCVRFTDDRGTIRQGCLGALDSTEQCTWGHLVHANVQQWTSSGWTELLLLNYYKEK